MSDAPARPQPTPTRPLPSLAEPVTAPFWRACAEHRLTYQVNGAGEVVFHPRSHDVHTVGGTLEARESAGSGVIYTFTVVRQHGHPYFRGHTPYVVAYVDLDEGFRIMAEVDADPAAVHIGQRVGVAWEDHEDVAVPLFRPTG